MSNDRHPRTLQEAFGPHTARAVEPMRDPPSPWKSHDLAIAAILVIALVLIVLGVS